MELKRQYLRDPDGRVICDAAAGKPTVIGVEVKHTGLKAEQTFSHRLITGAVAAGWARIDGDTLTIKATPEDLRYTITRHPGYSCRSTGERIPISDIGMTEYMGQPVATIAPREARAWLAARGLPPTDYEADRNYRCVLDLALHEKYRGVTSLTGQLVAANRMQGV